MIACFSLTLPGCENQKWKQPLFIGHLQGTITKLVNSHTYVHIYLKGREGKRVYLLVHSLITCNLQGWGGAKPGVRDLIQVCHVGDVDPSPGTSQNAHGQEDGIITMTRTRIQALSVRCEDPKCCPMCCAKCLIPFTCLSFPRSLHNLCCPHTAFSAHRGHMIDMEVTE